MVQLAVALGTVTIVAVTGVHSILGLGPAVFLIAGALAVGPAGRLSDRFGRMPVIRTGFALGIVGPLVTAAGCAADPASSCSSVSGSCGAAQSIVLLSRAAAAEMFPPERRARGMSIVLFARRVRRDLGAARLRPDVLGPQFDAHDLTVPWLAAGLFTLAGIAISFGIRRDPRDLSAAYVAPERRRAPLARDPPPPRRRDRDGRGASAASA